MQPGLAEGYAGGEVQLSIMPNRYRTVCKCKQHRPVNRRKPREPSDVHPAVAGVDVIAVADARSKSTNETNYCHSMSLPKNAWAGLRLLKHVGREIMVVSS